MADVAALRDDLATFSKAIGRPLTAWQVAALVLDAPNIEPAGTRE